MDKRSISSLPTIGDNEDIQDEDSSGSQSSSSGSGKRDSPLTAVFSPISGCAVTALPVLPDVRGPDANTSTQVGSTRPASSAPQQQQKKNRSTAQAESATAHPDGPVPVPRRNASEGSANCPFSLILAALESQIPQDLTEELETPTKPGICEAHEAQCIQPQKSKRSKPPPESDRTSAELDTFRPTDLEYQIIPEGRSLKAQGLLKGLSTSLQANDPAQKSSASFLMCPMSGASLQIEEKDEDSGSATGHVKKAGSRTSGSNKGSSSRKSGSKGGGSNGRSSRNSKGTGTSSSRRRSRKIPTFSEWEADNYIPIIKGSWSKVCQSVTPDEISNAFLEQFLQFAPELQHMLDKNAKIASAHFWSALSFISTSVDDPAGLADKLRELAPMHIEKGVKVEHLTTFGKALFKTLELFMGKEFSMETRTAWEWLWTWLAGVMTMTMEEASEEATLVSQSWDIVQENYPENAFGELLFDFLFSLAPNLKATFATPRQVLSVKFVEMISTIVTFNGDAATMEEQIVWLGIRHVAYGARHQHVQVMGQVLMNALARAVGDEWTAEMHKAWMDLWTSTCNSMLAITMEADKHGEVVRKLWADTKDRSSFQQFGLMLRKSLLSGTEWVQSLSVGIREGLDDAIFVKDPLKFKAKGKGKQDDRRRSLVEKLEKSSPDEEGGEEAVEEVDEALKDIEKSRSQKVGMKDDESGSDAIGQKFWDMITSLLDVLWEPERMNERIVIMTTKLFVLGIRPEHLPTIGKGIASTLKTAMGPDFKEEQSSAWNWFWKMASKPMEQVLGCLHRKEGAFVRASWQECKDTKPAEELGELIFQELGRLAPHIVHLFKRPKRIQALQFVSAIDMIVGFNEDPVKFFEILRPLAIRHIRYGVKADYARAFGRSILRSIAAVLGERYDERTAKAWDTLWLRVSCCVTRALAAGSNLIAVSLINENIDQMNSAMNAAPRCQRFKYLTELSLNGEDFSPLYWAIRDSQLEISKLIINDLLAIRADRHTYYYGREILFKAHPDLMMVLCKDMPMLLSTLFDGLLWHAQIVTDGQVRVNYYLREMYGDPRELDDPWNGPMGTMVLHGKPENFMHPVVEKLLELKFNRFGRPIYVAMQVWFVLILVLFTLGSTMHQESCDPNWMYLRIVVGIMAAITCLLQSTLIVRQLTTGQSMQGFRPHKKYVLSFTTALTPLEDDNRVVCRCNRRVWIVSYSIWKVLNPWNFARYLSVILIVIGFAFDACLFGPAAEPAPQGMSVEEMGLEGGTSWIYVLMAATSFLLWVQLMQVLIISAKFAALTYTIGCILPEIGRNLILVLVLFVACGAAMFALRLPGWTSLESSVLKLIQVVLGIAEEESYNLEGWAMFVIIGMIVLIQIGLFNILIAQLSMAYRSLVVNEKAFAMLNRAYICVEMESFLPIKYRMKFYNEIGFDNPLEFDPGDEGPTGGVQFRCPASIRVDEKYIPDRVERFTGEASPMDPWPTEDQMGGEINEEDEKEDGEAIVDGVAGV